MRKISSIAYYELLRMIRAKETFWLNVVMPIILIFILGNALSGVFQTGDTKLDPVLIGIVYEDENSEMYADMLHSEQLSAWLTPTEFDHREQLLDALKAQEVDYGLVIPEDFSSAMTAGMEARWELYPGSNESDRLIVESAIGSVLDQMNFVQASLKTIGPMALPAAGMASTAVPSQAVEIIRPDFSEKSYSAMQYYAAEMLVMFLLYSGLATAFSIANEKSTHTLDRLYTAPLRPVHIFSGKMLGCGLVAFGQAAAIILFTKWVYGVDWGDRYGFLILACVFTIVGSLSIAVIVSAFSSNTKTVQMIQNTIIIIMTLLSGGFSPEIGDFLTRLGQFTLSEWASQSFIHLILESPGSVVREHLTVLGSIAASLFIVSALLGRKAVSYEK